MQTQNISWCGSYQGMQVLQTSFINEINKVKYEPERERKIWERRCQFLCPFMHIL